MDDVALDLIGFLRLIHTCHAALIHTCRAVPMPFSYTSMSFVKVRVVAGKSRTRADHPHAVCSRPMLSYTCHAHAATLRSRFQNGVFVASHGLSLACANQT
jgi:hypothetical protein